MPDQHKQKVVTKEEWADQLIQHGLDQLVGADLATQASCLQCLAILAFQRTTEKSADVMIEAVDKVISEHFNIPPSEQTKLSAGVRMARLNLKLKK